MEQKEFFEFIRKIEESLQDLEQKQNFTSLSKKLVSFYPTMARTYSKPLEILFNDYQSLGKFLDKVNHSTKSTMKEYLGYKISHEHQEIILIHQNGGETRHKLIPTPVIIEKGLGYNKQTLGFWLLSSFFSQEDNLGSLQIFNIFNSKLEIVKID